VKTAICQGSNDVKVSPWKWSVKALSQSDCPIVSTRKSQYRAIGLRHKAKMLRSRATRRVLVVRQYPVVYRDYLLSPEWQEKRKEALRLAGYRCQVCYAGDVTLDVHHRTYKRLGHELMTDLVVLCRPCHGIFHKHGKLARYGD
jgi:5-methylcytosine-specific restriction endonuclease McrA